MSISRRSRLAGGAIAAALGLMPGLVLVDAPVASAAAATVGNGISTTDLGVVGVTPASLAGALVGTGVSVSNATFTGANAQAGLIHVVDPAVVAFNDGIILSSGNIADVMGPNSSDGITGDMGGSADADLNALIADSQTVYPMTFDAAVLEFDFVPAASTVYFTYTFGSDEYLEWVNLFNDVFAFYVNGQNCATVPDGSPISIDTINDTVNPGLFRDNSFSNPPANPINVESDGLSVELICSAAVNAGQTNHMKLAIADTSDQILDSVVILKADSLSTRPPESCNDGVDNDDDTLVDMDDDSCTSTTTPPPAGSGGVGSGYSSPPFTGTEGAPVVLDASALGWTPSSDTVSTSWTVTGINGTVGSCVVTPSTPQPVLADGAAAVATAVCPADGEYVARIDGLDVEGGSSWDTDVDFFVHNAPPAVSIESPTLNSVVDTGVVVDLSASVADPGVGDGVTCSIDWGDGTVEAGLVADGVCTGSHDFGSAGFTIISVTASDDMGDSAAAATIVEVTGAVNHPPTVSAGGPYSSVEGSAVTITGAATDADGDALTTTWSITQDGTTEPGAMCTVANTAALTTTVTCNDNATFTATLGADDGTTVVQSTAVLTTSNVAPTVSIAAPATGATAAVGSTVSLSAPVADAGSNDTLTCTVSWGDGTVNSTGVITGGSCTSAHVFTAAANRTITVTVVDDDGGSRSTSRVVTVVAAPTITGLSPTSGPVGTTVTITGTNFSGASAVRFNGLAAKSFTVSRATKITAVVPAGATTGKVSVVKAGGTAYSVGNFTVTVPAPTISSFTPTTGGIGAAVTITGTNFTGATSVKFNTTLATRFTVLSATTIIVGIPAGATTGRITVVTPGGTAQSKSSLTVSGTALPTITGFTATSGSVGAKITVTGAHLGAALTVTVNRVAAVFTVSSATTIVVTIPAGATSGKIRVTTAGGSVTSVGTLTIT